MANDIDFLGEEIPVPFKTGLKGQFNGDNFKLKNFKVPYVNYNGIFGMMSQGTGVVKNLIIEDISYDNYENIENRKSTSLYVGLITRELGSNAKVENVTFNNINVNLYTQTYGVRFFGLVASINKGKIDGITLNNVNININFKDLLEVQIGGVIGKNFSTGKITKINYASGSFNLLVEEHTSYTQSIYQMFFGAIVGEGGGQISEIVNQANVNVKLKDVSDDQKVVVVEGEYVTVNAESLENGSTTNKFVVVNKNESVKLTFNNLHDEKIHTILINGVDRTTEVVEKSLTFDPSDEDIYVKVLYKVVDEGKKLTLTGSNYRIVSAKLGETVIYNGLGSIPSEWVYGTTIVVKGIASNGKVATIRVNGVLYEMNNDVIEFTIIKNSTIDVRSSQIKTIYIGGIAGAVSTIDNALFMGDINFNLQKVFPYVEDYQVGGIAGKLYSTATHVGIVSSNINVLSDSPSRTLVLSRLVANTIKNDGIVDYIVLNSTIKLNGIDYNDGLETVDVMPEDAFTSEFVKGLLP